MEAIARYKIKVLKEELKECGTQEMDIRSLRRSALISTFVNKDPENSEKLIKIVARSGRIMNQKALEILRDILLERVNEEVIKKLQKEGVPEQTVAKIMVKNSRGNLVIAYHNLDFFEKKFAQKIISTDFVEDTFVRLHSLLKEEVNEHTLQLIIQRTYRILWSLDLQETLCTFDEFSKLFKMVEKGGEETLEVDFQRMTKMDAMTAIEVMNGVWTHLQNEIISKYESLGRGAQEFEN